MFFAYVVLAIMLILVLVNSARGKLTRDEKIVSGLAALRVPDGWLPKLAALEIAGAVGLATGFLYLPLGVAAAVGILLYFLGATVAHLRVKDFKPALVPAVLALVAALALVYGTGSS